MKGVSSRGRDSKDEWVVISSDDSCGVSKVEAQMFFQIKLNMFVDDFVHCDKPLVEASVLKHRAMTCSIMIHNNVRDCRGGSTVKVQLLNCFGFFKGGHEFGVNLKFNFSSFKKYTTVRRLKLASLHFDIIMAGDSGSPLPIRQN